MKPHDFKESSVDASRYLPPLADDKDIQPRLIRLSALLEQICEKLVESMAAARALGIVDAMLALRLVNFDALMLAFDAVEEIFLTDSFPTTKETRCPELVKEAFDLAADILADVPLGYAVGENAPNADELATMKAAASQLGCAGAEDESTNLSPARKGEIIYGKISKLRKIVTQNNELMAEFLIGDALVVAFPKTFHKYRRSLEAWNGSEIEVDVYVQSFERDDSEHFNMLQLVSPAPVAEKPEFTLGQRVRLTRDLPDTVTDIHPVHLYKGDEGIVHLPYEGSELGFRSDRWGDITHFRKEVDGKFQLVLDFCEPIFEHCVFCNAQSVNPQTKECSNCYASFKSEGLHEGATQHPDNCNCADCYEPEELDGSEYETIAHERYVQSLHKCVRCGADTSDPLADICDSCWKGQS